MLLFPFVLFQRYYSFFFCLIFLFVDSTSKTSIEQERGIEMNIDHIFHVEVIYHKLKSSYDRLFRKLQAMILFQLEQKTIYDFIAPKEMSDLFFLEKQIYRFNTKEKAGETHRKDGITLRFVQCDQKNDHLLIEIKQEQHRLFGMIEDWKATILYEQEIKKISNVEQSLFHKWTQQLLHYHMYHFLNYVSADYSFQTIPHQDCLNRFDTFLLYYAKMWETQKTFPEKNKVDFFVQISKLNKEVFKRLEESIKEYENILFQYVGFLIIFEKEELKRDNTSNKLRS